MAGIAAHAMANVHAATQTEAPQPAVMSVAAKSISRAGAVARTAELAAFFRIQQLDEERTNAHHATHTVQCHVRVLDAAVRVRKTIGLAIGPKRDDSAAAPR